MLNRLNHWISAGFDALLWPAERFGPAWAMVYLSAITAVVCVWLFGLTSNQKAIEQIKERIGGNLIGVRLFQNDLGIVMRLQGRLLGLTARYMGHSLVPMCVMLVPVILILIQMNEYYESRPLQPGETTLLKVKVTEPGLLSQISLVESASLPADAPPVPMPAENEIDWRLQAASSGDTALSLQLGEQSIAKSAAVGGPWRRLTTTRGSSIEDRLLNPGEPGLEARHGIERISLNYPKAALEILGLQLHWLVWFFILTLIIGYAIKGFMGVKI